MLAKIAYAYAAAVWQIDKIIPMLADIVLWKTDKSPYLVGGGIDFEGTPEGLPR